MTPNHAAAPALESDHQILMEIRDNTRTTNTKLFGTPEDGQENETGRLPVVEKSVKSAHERIDDIEKIIWKATGFAAAASAAVSIALDHLVTMWLKH